MCLTGRLRLESGEEIVAHCPNTGSMKTLLDNEVVAYVLPNDDPKRKLKYTLYLLELSNGAKVCVNTQLPYCIDIQCIEGDWHLNVKAKLPYLNE